MNTELIELEQKPKSIERKGALNDSDPPVEADEPGTEKFSRKIIPRQLFEFPSIYESSTLND